MLGPPSGGLTPHTGQHFDHSEIIFGVMWGSPWVAFGSQGVPSGPALMSLEIPFRSAWGHAGITFGPQPGRLGVTFNQFWDRVGVVFGSLLDHARNPSTRSNTFGITVEALRGYFGAA